MTDIIAMHRADLVDAVTAAVAPIKAERDALAAELAQAQTSRAALADGVVEAEARIRELEAALRKIRKGYNPHTLFDEIDAVLTPLETDCEHNRDQTA